MKKFLLPLVALVLLSIPLQGQETESLGSYAELTLIPRLDVSPTLYQDSPNEINFGNSSFYTLFEGAFSDNLSFTIVNHWFHLDPGDYAWPYQNIGRSDDWNFLDYFNVNYNLGSWTFTLGKDVMTMGGYEFDDWDWDTHVDLASPLWNNLPCFQWGGKVTYLTPSEQNSFSLQATSSPYGERPFSSGLWAYSLGWRGEYETWGLIGSVSALQMDESQYQLIACLGTQVQLSTWGVLTLDWNNTGGYNDNDWTFLEGNCFQGKLSVAAGESWDFSIKGIYNLMKNKNILPSTWTLGGVAQFYPIKGSEDLRLHAYIAYNSINSGLSLNIGARYQLRFNLW